MQSQPPFARGVPVEDADGALELLSTIPLAEDLTDAYGDLYEEHPVTPPDEARD